jgi:hypothetical protein
MRLLFYAHLTERGCPPKRVNAKTVSELHTKIVSFVAHVERDAGTPAGEYEQHKAFYDDTRATISTIRLRAESVPKNSVTVEMVKLLEDSTDKLRQLHMSGGKGGLSKPLGDPALAALDVQFKSLLTFEIAKQRDGK